MNTLTDLLLGVGQPRVSHFPDLCTLLYTYLSTLDYWTKIVYYLFTQTSPVAHTSALTPTYIKSQKLPNWPISKELGLGRMLLPHWKLLFESRHHHLSESIAKIAHFNILSPPGGVTLTKNSKKIHFFKGCGDKMAITRLIIKLAPWNYFHSMEN